MMMMMMMMMINFPTSDQTDLEKEKPNKISLEVFGLAENEEDFDEESE